jgi:predicted 3-demethylubiquinone-9 3-methyltransferase (glyoxalase superfamily)
MQKITPFLWFENQAEEAVRSQRVMQAMLKMVKLDIKKLKQAYGKKKIDQHARHR